MKQIIETTLPPFIAFQEDKMEAWLRKKLQIVSGDTFSYRLIRRSIDARSRKVKVNIAVEAYINSPEPPLLTYHNDYKSVADADPIIVVGAGPAGMFAALKLIELGLKPIVLERGKDVRTRRRDLAAINKDHVVNPESNYCFGEGGAGTYSDGKLYTRSKKRGSWRRVLEIFVAHGAHPDILVDAHPHIGTNKLPQIVSAIRESIINAGGEVHFDTKVVDFILDGDEMKGVITEQGDKLTGNAVLLATGHSARDIFELLHKKSILIEAKPFALGIRIEHQQQLIDQIQYHCDDRGEFLPAAAYSLVSQIDYKGVKKGVFSFCMCPGGFIVPSATAPGEIVVNGMSPSRRDSKYSNSGIVMSVDERDWRDFSHMGPLAGMAYQRKVEQKAFLLSGKTQAAPAQRMVDFTENKVSNSLLDTSYQPGLVSMDMREILPKPVAHRLRYAFKNFGKKMKGYFTNESQLIGVESRTSSPVRIPRDRESLEHPQMKRLFPCAEGAGYAGGIASAAIDGERCAEMIAELYGKRKVSFS